MNAAPSSNPASSRVPSAVLDAAIAWRLRLDAGEADRAALDDWLHAHADHARVWRQFEELDGRIGGVGRSGRAALIRSAQAGSRAAARLALGLGLALGCLLPLANHELPLRHALADEVTHTAERREIVLPDRTRVQLNARTAVDIAFDAKARRLELRTGEVLVETAHGDARPFLVTTVDGELRALGTRFLVRRVMGEGTQLIVLQSAVEATARNGEQRIAREGESLWLHEDKLGATQPAPHGADAWVRGWLAVEGETLARVVETLALHSARPITVDARVAHLRVTGTFPLDDPDTALAALTQTLSVQQSRWAGWWIRLGPRED